MTKTDWSFTTTTRSALNSATSDFSVASFLLGNVQDICYKIWYPVGSVHEEIINDKQVGPLLGNVQAVGYEIGYQVGSVMKESLITAKLDLSLVTSNMLVMKLDTKSDQSMMKSSMTTKSDLSLATFKMLVTKSGSKLDWSTKKSSMTTKLDLFLATSKMLVMKSDLTGMEVKSDHSMKKSMKYKSDLSSANFPTAKTKYASMTKSCISTNKSIALVTHCTTINMSLVIANSSNLKQKSKPPFSVNNLMNAASKLCELKSKELTMDEDI